MKRTWRRRTGAGFGLVLAVAGAVSACSSTRHSSSPSTTGVAPATNATPTSTSNAPTTTSVPGEASPGPGQTTTTLSGGPFQCPTADLAGSLTGANGAAGSVYYRLLLTNHGRSACVVQGWPGVSFVTGTGGQQVGAPAGRTPGSAPLVTLPPGVSAQSTLQITDASNYGAGCGVTPAVGLRIYPPDQTAALFVAHADQACSNPADVTLHVGALQPSS